MHAYFVVVDRGSSPYPKQYTKQLTRKQVNICRICMIFRTHRILASRKHVDGKGRNLLFDSELLCESCGVLSKTKLHINVNIFFKCHHRCFLKVIYQTTKNNDPLTLIVQCAL